MARAICLILVPLAFYMAMFRIHFAILRNSGDGDAFMTSEFQHTLDGKGMQDTYAGERECSFETSLSGLDTELGTQMSHLAQR